MLAAAPANQCVRACEEIRELAVPITHGSYYEVRPPALDGTGEITLRDLVKFVLTIRRGAFRAFYSSPAGLVVVLVGAALCALGAWWIGRLGRAHEERRVFGGAHPWEAPA